MEKTKPATGPECRARVAALKGRGAELTQTLLPIVDWMRTAELRRADLQRSRCALANEQEGIRLRLAEMLGLPLWRRANWGMAALTMTPPATQIRASLLDELIEQLAEVEKAIAAIDLNLARAAADYESGRARLAGALKIDRAHLLASQGT